MHDAIRANPLATLITGGRSGLIANLVPFSLHATASGDVLRAHLAKANGQIADMREHVPAIVMFQGPQAYVSPSWYPTKVEHGKVVPTWNYVVVQVWGTPTLMENKEWLREQLEHLTNVHEGSRSEPWSIDDAPEEFVEALLNGIVGLEIPIERIEGKWKVSQNQCLVNQAGVMEGLRCDGHAHLADEVAARIHEG